MRKIVSFASVCILLISVVTILGSIHAFADSPAEQEPYVIELENGEKFFYMAPSTGFVKNDGEKIDASNYTVSGTSEFTEIIFKEEYLKTLSDGDYMFPIMLVVFIVLSIVALCFAIGRKQKCK